MRRLFACLMYKHTRMIVYHILVFVISLHKNWWQKRLFINTKESITGTISVIVR